MKPVAAEFRPATLPPRWAWWLVALCALPVVAVAGYAWQARQGAAQALQALESARRERSAPAPVAAPMTPAGPYERSAREMLALRALPWAAALTALEATPMAGVTPRGVDALATEGTVRVEVAAADMAVLLKYLDALNAGAAPGGLRWTLLQAQQDAASGGLVAVLVARSVPR